MLTTLVALVRHERAVENAVVLIARISGTGADEVGIVCTFGSSIDRVVCRARRCAAGSLRAEAIDTVSKSVVGSKAKWVSRLIPWATTTWRHAEGTGIEECWALQ